MIAQDSKLSINVNEAQLCLVFKAGVFIFVEVAEVRNLFNISQVEPLLEIFQNQTVICKLISAYTMIEMLC